VLQVNPRNPPEIDLDRKVLFQMPRRLIATSNPTGIVEITSR
jgi:hypothetical protein